VVVVDVEVELVVDFTVVVVAALLASVDVGVVVTSIVEMLLLFVANVSLLFDGFEVGGDELDSKLVEVGIVLVLCVIPSPVVDSADSVIETIN
jgi:hypothetical protein